MRERGSKFWSFEDKAIVQCRRSKNFTTHFFVNFQKHRWINELHAKDGKFVCTVTRKPFQNKLKQEVENK